MSHLFTYPFRYVPSPEVSDAAAKLIARISGDPHLNALFAEGKMLGVLVCREKVLYAFSGLVFDPQIGRATPTVPGFVAPIFDYTAPEGYFRSREAEISLTRDPQKAAEMSRDLQAWLFRQYKVMNAIGEESTILDIFAERGIVPPGGTGECAAPKLLNYAYRNGLTPLSMGEFWYGASPRGQVREQGRFYPSCTGKCGPLLTWMLRGMDVEPNPLDAPFVSGEPVVLYEDDAIVVVKKPGGMLSVEGKTAAPCLRKWLESRYGEVHSCHRLDQDTSGVMVYARSLAAKVNLEAQFASREVSKTYRARLVASMQPWNHARKGTIALPLMLDYDDRPRQMVDLENGKIAVTRYEVLDIFPDGEVDIRFFPETGRTHQLRVHSAHALGLGRPIKGDNLYGAPSSGALYLLAESLKFKHPTTGQPMEFTV